MIEMYKIWNGKYDQRVADFIALNTSRTKGHHLKVYKQHTWLAGRLVSCKPSSLTLLMVTRLPCRVNQKMAIAAGKPGIPATYLATEYQEVCICPQVSKHMELLTTRRHILRHEVRRGPVRTCNR